MTSVAVSQWAPKFGNINNSEPAVQGEVTINTYLRVGEFNLRNYNIGTKSEKNTKIVFPYGTHLTNEVKGVEEHEVALLVREDERDTTGKTEKKRFRDGAVRPKGKKVDNYPLVITSLNGMCLKSTEDGFDKKFWNYGTELQKAFIRKEFCPIGVIGTTNSLDSKDNRYTYPYFPTRVAGVFAMQNGPKKVMAGDFLVIDAPKPNQGSDFQRDAALDKLSRLPQKKATMEIVPLDYAQQASFTALDEFVNITSEKVINDLLKTEEKDIDGLHCFETFILRNVDVLKELTGNPITDKTQLVAAFTAHSELLRKLYESYSKCRTELSQRIVGRAMTHMDVGCEGDVYVGKGYFV